MKIKVGIIYSGAKYWGGIEEYLLRLFAKYPQEKVELILLTLGDWPLNRKIKNQRGRVKTFSDRRVRPSTIREISDFARKENIRLIVSQGMVGSFYARRVAKKVNLPVLITIHSDFRNDYPGAGKRAIYLLSTKFFQQKEDNYIAVSKYLKRLLIKSGIPEEKVRVIYNGVADFHGIKEKNQVGEIVVGSVGRLHPTKGFDKLIDAGSLLADLPVKIKIWGKGTEESMLNAKRKMLKVEERVELMGFGKNLQQALGVIDIYVQPSRSEGFGLTVVQAMLAEKPIVVTPVGSLPEIIKDRETGLVSSNFSAEAIADKIRELINNRELAQKLAKEARKDALERFSEEKWLEATIDTYRDIAS